MTEDFVRPTVKEDTKPPPGNDATVFFFAIYECGGEEPQGAPTPPSRFIPVDRPAPRVDPFPGVPDDELSESQFAERMDTIREWFASTPRVPRVHAAGGRGPSPSLGPCGCVCIDECTYREGCRLRPLGY
jgi:hypothetical protein